MRGIHSRGGYHVMRATNKDRVEKAFRTLPGRGRHRDQEASGVSGILWWRAGVVSDPKRDAALLWLALLLVAASRWLAFPASIWDMDEANFALGVIDFDPVHNQPHAPFFPLWIGLGKVVHWLLPVSQSTTALQVVSAGFSVAIVVPMVRLWSAMMSHRQAWAATGLYLFLPGAWLLSGRAYTEPAATALLVAVVAAWMPDSTSRRGLVAGAVALAAALLIRPQWLPVAVPLIVWRVLRLRRWREWLIVVGVPGVIGAAVVAVVAGHAGGMAPLWAAVEQHRKYIAGAAEGFDWSFADLGVHAVAGGLVAGTAWLFLAAIGSWSLLRDPRSRGAAIAVFGLVLTPYVILLLATQNPTLPRYALPVLALTSGAVVAGIGTVLGSRKWALGAVVAWVAGSVFATVPVLDTYRSQLSPVIAAFERVASDRSLSVVAMDRRLVAFVTFEQVRGSLRQPIVWDYQVELGMVGSGFRRDLAAVTGGEAPPWVSPRGEVTTFSCDEPLLRRVASPRFLEVTVVEGCGLVKPENPSVRIEDLRPGLVIPAE